MSAVTVCQPAKRARLAQYLYRLSRRGIRCTANLTQEGKRSHRQSGTMPVPMTAAADPSRPAFSVGPIRNASVPSGHIETAAARLRDGSSPAKSDTTPCSREVGLFETSYCRPGNPAILSLHESSSRPIVLGLRHPASLKDQSGRPLCGTAVRDRPLLAMIQAPLARLSLGRPRGSARHRD